MPEHLRWSPDIEDDLFSNQSATLYTTYYLLLILVYRPFSTTSAFLPQPNQDVPTNNPASGITPSKPFPFPADSIIASAAQSAIRIVEVQTGKGLSNIPNMLAVAQISAVTRLMGMHAAATSSAGPLDMKARLKEREKALGDVEKCIKCLEMAESRWIMARKFLWVLATLSVLTKLMIPPLRTGIRASLPEPGDPVVFAPKPTQPRVPSQPKVGHGRPTVPTVPSQSWSTTPTPPSAGSETSRAQKMTEAEQALTNHANWRWFHQTEHSSQNHAGYALSQGQVRGQTVRTSGYSQHPAHHIPLRHHVVIPAMRSSESPAPHSQFPTPPSLTPVPSHPHSMSQSPVSAGAYAGRTDMGRRLSAPLTIPNAPFSGIHDLDSQQPISSTLRSGGSPASAGPPAGAGFFGAPQSAAREEYAGHAQGRGMSGAQGGWVQPGQRMKVPSHPYATVQARGQERSYE